MLSRTALVLQWPSRCISYLTLYTKGSLTPGLLCTVIVNPFITLITWVVVFLFVYSFIVCVSISLLKADSIFSLILCYIFRAVPSTIYKSVDIMNYCLKKQYLLEKIIESRISITHYVENTTQKDQESRK